MAQSFRDLIVWQEAKKLTKRVYQETAKFPPQQTFGLTSQMQRASISICSNIAEGWGRNAKKQLAQFLNIASGSLAELECQIELCYDCNLLNTQVFEEMKSHCNKIGYLLNNFRSRLR